MPSRRHVTSTLARLGLLAALAGGGVGAGLALDDGTEAVLGAGPPQRVRALAALERDTRVRDRASARGAAVAPHDTPTAPRAASTVATTTTAPATTMRTAPAPRHRTVTVEPGQGLWWIADTYLPDTAGPVSISRAVRRLRGANPRLVRDGDVLHVGDRLRLPSS